MSTITSQQLIDRLHWRYATKQFDPAHKISAADWTALEHALVLTPSSYGLQPYKFLVITDPATREKLRPASWGQAQVTDSSHLVVFAVKTSMSEKHVDDFLARTAEVRGGNVEALATYRQMMIGDIVTGPRSAIAKEWATRQAYIALGNFMTSASLLGIDTCPLEGFEPAKYDEILNLPAHSLASVVACAAGYRATGDKYATLPKVRFKNEDLILRI